MTTETKLNEKIETKSKKPKVDKSKSKVDKTKVVEGSSSQISKVDKPEVRIISTRDVKTISVYNSRGQLHATHHNPEYIIIHPKSIVSFVIDDKFDHRIINAYLSHSLIKLGLFMSLTVVDSELVASIYNSKDMQLSITINDSDFITVVG